MSISRLSGYCLRLYTVLMMFFLAFVAFIWAREDLSWSDLTNLGPGTNSISLIMSIVLIWGLVTVALFMLRFGKVNTRNVMHFACGFAICMLYFSILRERVYFGDYLAYVGAAKDILAGRPFNHAYVYPPLWASILADIMRLFGKEAAVYACFAINQLSVAGFFVLASLLLTRCGLSLNLASLVMFAALCVNVPALRNLAYVQVNLLLMDLVLASVLLFSRTRFVSACLLAAAVHLKIVPLFFAPVFVQTRRWMWLVFFVLAGGGLALLTILTDGSSYYFDFMSNVTRWSPPSLRSCSIRGFLGSTEYGTGWGMPVRTISIVASAILFGIIYWMSYLSIRKRVFARSGEALSDSVINGIVPILFLMPALSPAVWVHHLVVLIVPAILVLVRLQTARTGCLFAAGYFFTFLMPVFDCYPWSYLRLAGWMTLLGLAVHVIRAPTTPRWPFLIDRAMDSFLGSILGAFESVKDTELARK